MTQEEKAKAYNEALERAKYTLTTDLHESGVWVVKHIFPQLAESEDEKIKKEIRTLYKEIDSCIGELLKARTNKDTGAEGKALFKMEGLMVRTLQDLSCIEDYLEKQKEKKPAWSEEDEIYLQDALWCVKQASKVAKGENDMGACWSAERWLKSLPRRLK